MSPQERAALVARLRYGVKSDLTPLERVPRIAADEIEALAQQVATLRAVLSDQIRFAYLNSHIADHAPVTLPMGVLRKIAAALAQTEPKVTT